MDAKQFADILRAAEPTDVIDPEDAAVFIADESGHPYDWRRIVEDRGVYRRLYRAAEKRLPDEPKLQERLLDAKRSLDRKHRL